jgi:type IV pilus assembly protein PilB
MLQISNEIARRVADLLVSSGLADGEMVRAVVDEAENSGLSIVQVLEDREIADDEVIVRTAAEVLNVPYVDLVDTKVDQETLLKLPMETAQRTMAVIIGEEDGQLLAAMQNPSDVQAVDYLTTLVGMPVKAFMASENGIKHILGQYREDFSNINKAVAATNVEIEERAAKNDAETITQDSPISKALNTILEYAVKSKASDIHIEPLEDILMIRCRVDGVLRKIMELPRSIEPALISRVKILAGLKIDEHRLPQDGQFSVEVEGREIDLRIAISPVIWGEQAVLRLLDKSTGTLTLEKMGITGRSLRAVKAGIAKPNGMILTSGPTGSGKTTTMYALLQEIKKESINIVTLEDPVEYKIPGVNQIQVNLEAGLTFATGLRSILRQDPDVVMIGEIRDRETANLAVQAALTGHLVFSTLHTNSAAGILPRLLDMGIESFLLASTLNTVIGQRLVRRIADEGKEKYHSNDIQTKEIRAIVDNLLPSSSSDIERVSRDLGYDNLPLSGQSSYELSKGIDSPEMPGGYSGRVGLFEAMTVDEDIQKMIVSRATAGEIMRMALLKGMISVRQDGILKALDGATTIEEVNRVASDIA